MRLGVSTDLGAKSAQEWAKAQKDLGCGCVTFPLNCHSDEAKIDEYVKAAKENDLLIAEVGIWRNAISFDEDERKECLKYSIDQLALADRIGARCCVNVAGAAGKIWDGGYKENFSKEMWDRTVKMIQTVIDEVKPVNTYFSLEPMPWMIPTSPEEYLHLIEDVARDRFAVHMDIINMINCPERYFFQEEFLERTFSLLGDKIRSCHLKDVFLREDFTFQLVECACGKGAYNIEKYAELATKADPDMPLILEHLDSDDKYIQSLAYVKNRLGVK